MSVETVGLKSLVELIASGLTVPLRMPARIVSQLSKCRISSIQLGGVFGCLPADLCSLLGALGRLLLFGLFGAGGLGSVLVDIILSLSNLGRLLGGRLIRGKRDPESDKSRERSEQE